MFCSRCGKKVLENMMFCPFCGAELVVPRQDAEADGDTAPTIKAKAEPAETVNLERFTFDIPADDDARTAKPAPLPRFEAGDSTGTMPEWSAGTDSFMDDEDESTADAEAPAASDETSYYRRRDGDIRRERGGSDRPVSGERHSAKAAFDARSHRQAGTFVPEKPLRSEDIFMDDVADAEDDYDAYDRYEESRSGHGHYHHHYRDDDDDDDEDDDDEGRGFFARHIRGIVGTLLFLALIVLMVFYFMSDAGQNTLARIDATLPLKASAYARLGREYYEAGDYSRAGVNYARALVRQPGSYDWASSAAMAYNAAGDKDNTVEMLKKCIEINPNALEPYIYLVNLYPSPSGRPAEVERLIRQGVERTGDYRLNAG